MDPRKQLESAEERAGLLNRIYTHARDGGVSHLPFCDSLAEEIAQQAALVVRLRAQVAAILTRREAP